MLEQIANVVGINISENSLSYNRLRRIKAKMDENVTVDSPNFSEAVLAADAAVDQESQVVFGMLVNQLMASQEPKERVYKIKRSLKGERIKTKSASGKSFSFGPTWVESVKAGKGIAVSLANREKLEMHAAYVGLTDFDAMDSKTLAAAIAVMI